MIGFLTAAAAAAQPKRSSNACLPEKQEKSRASPLHRGGLLGSGGFDHCPLSLWGGSLLKTQSPLKAPRCGRPREGPIGTQQKVERRKLHEEKEQEEGHLSKTAKGRMTSSRMQEECPYFKPRMHSQLKRKQALGGLEQQKGVEG